MKKILCVLLCMVLVLGLGACGAKQTHVHEYSDGVCVTCGKIDPDRYANILLIGNSYTHYNDNALARNLEALATDAGYYVTVDQLAVSAANLTDYLTGACAPSLTRLRTCNGYDYVVLQEQSNGPLTEADRFFSSVKSFKSLLSNYNSPQIVMYMTWARAPGNPWLEKNGYTRQSMTDGLYQAYSQAAESVGALLAPVGLGFMDIDPTEVDMYQPDLTHPTPNGSYLAGLVMYATIFGQDPLEATYCPEEVTAKDAALLRQAAHDAIEEAKEK